MEFNYINVKFIKYRDNNIYYFGKPLIIETDICNVYKSIEEKDDKYYIILEISKELHEFFNKIDVNNKAILGVPKYEPISWNYGDKYYCKIKIPRRYNKFEFEVVSNRIYLPTSFDIKEGIKIKCKICIKNIWNYEELGGCYLFMKEVNIL
jgi:hypothetical protein